MHRGLYRLIKECFYLFVCFRIEVILYQSGMNTNLIMTLLLLWEKKWALLRLSISLSY